MSIIINTKKVILNDGSRGRKIVRLRALTAEELPPQYVNCGINVCYNPETKGLVQNIVNHPPSPIFTPSQIIKEQDFQEQMKYIKAAGAKLMKIKQDIAKKQNWAGNQSYTI